MSTVVIRFSFFREGPVVVEGVGTFSAVLVTIPFPIASAGPGASVEAIGSLALSSAAAGALACSLFSRSQ